MPKLENGRYTIVYSDGQYRTIRVSAWRKKTILGLPTGKGEGDSDFKWTGIAFLNEGNVVQFWRKFEAGNPPEKLARIRRAIEVIASEPRKAQLAYALKEQNCARCGRRLTVPASIANGLGPECAGKTRWTKDDNQLAFEKEQASAA